MYNGRKRNSFELSLKLNKNNKLLPTIETVNIISDILKFKLNAVIEKYFIEI